MPLFVGASESYDTDAWEAYNLKKENAKLRALVRSYESLSAVLCNERECAGCPFDSTEHVLCEHMRLVACMGELGIDVSDG